VKSKCTAKILVTTKLMHDVGITLVKQKSGEVHLASPIFLSKIFVYGTLMVDEVLSRLGLKINSKFEARLN
jgi:hypothetical protein